MDLEKLNSDFRQLSIQYLHAYQAKDLRKCNSIVNQQWQMIVKGRVELNKQRKKEKAPGKRGLKSLAI